MAGGLLSKRAALCGAVAARDGGGGRRTGVLGRDSSESDEIRLITCALILLCTFFGAAVRPHAPPGCALLNELDAWTGEAEGAADDCDELTDSAPARSCLTLVDAAAPAAGGALLCGGLEAKNDASDVCFLALTVMGSARSLCGVDAGLGAAAAADPPDPNPEAASNDGNPWPRRFGLLRWLLWCGSAGATSMSTLGALDDSSAARSPPKNEGTAAAVGLQEYCEINAGSTKRGGSS